MGARLGGKGNPVSKPLKVIAWFAIVAVAWFLLAAFAPRLANEILNTIVGFFQWLGEEGADEGV